MKITPFRIEQYFAQYEHSAPYQLCNSDCESLEIGDLLALEPGAEESFSSLWLGYTENPGDPVLRETIASLYQGISMDQILVHSGAEEAIFNFMNVALEPGDHVIVTSPCYQSLAEVARAIGAEVTDWRGDPARAWEFDLGSLKEALTAQTKLVVINFPHNPTGFLPTRAFQQELSDLSNEHGFLVFSDEVYRGLEHDPDLLLPAFAELNERAVSLGVMSKTYGLPGLRIGWTATRNEQILSALASFKDYTSICNSAPSEFLATIALKHRDKIVQRNLEIIRQNLDRLDTFFEAHRELFNWYRPRAGSIAFPTLRQGEVFAFCQDLVQEAGVFLLPGTVYGDETNSFRLGFGRRNLPESLGKLEQFLLSSPAGEP